MTKAITLFVISLLVAPGLGLFASLYGMHTLVSSSGLGSTADAVAACASALPDLPAGCATLKTLQLLMRLASVALVGTLALPLIYLGAAVVLGRSRQLLATCFPWLVRIILAILPLVLALHGLLIWFGAWELIEMGLLPSDYRVALLFGGLGLVLVIAAISIVADMRKMLELEPLHVTGVLLEKHELPDLFERVARLARHLGSREPERIILGIEPTAYVANVPVKLRGVGDLPTAETLYLSTVALRALDDAELDALIGHELGHFRGADVEFSTRFAPAFRSLAIASQTISNERDEEDSMSIALIPAVGMLAFMTYTLTRIVSGIQREREFAADQASLEVSTPQAATKLLVKFSTLTLCWHRFHAGSGRLLHRGVTRRNLSSDYIIHTRQFLAATSPEVLRRWLIESHIPHPLDTHPSAAQRAAALGVEPDSILVASLASLAADRPASVLLEAIEERISQIDADYYRHPAQRVEISSEPELPPELTFTKV